MKLITYIELKDDSDNSSVDCYSYDGQLFDVWTSGYVRAKVTQDVILTVCGKLVQDGCKILNAYSYLGRARNEAN